MIRDQRKRRRRGANTFLGPFLSSPLLGPIPSLVQRDFSRGFAGCSRGFERGWNIGLGRVVNLLMLKEIFHLQVMGTAHLIPRYTALTLQLVQPPKNQLRGVVIEGEKKAREGSRGCAKPAGVVAMGPHQDERQSGVTADPAHAFGLRKFRFDSSNSCHSQPLFSMLNAGRVGPWRAG